MAVAVTNIQARICPRHLDSELCGEAVLVKPEVTDSVHSYLKHYYQWLLTLCHGWKRKVPGLERVVFVIKRYVRVLLRSTRWAMFVVILSRQQTEFLVAGNYPTSPVLLRGHGENREGVAQATRVLASVVVIVQCIGRDYPDYSKGP